MAGTHLVTPTSPPTSHPGSVASSSNAPGRVLLHRAADGPSGCLRHHHQITDSQGLKSKNKTHTRTQTCQHKGNPFLTSCRWSEVRCPEEAPLQPPPLRTDIPLRAVRDQARRPDTRQGTSPCSALARPDAPATAVQPGTQCPASWRILSTRTRTVGKAASRGPRASSPAWPGSRTPPPATPAHTVPGAPPPAPWPRLGLSHCLWRRSSLFPFMKIEKLWQREIT